MRLDGGRMASQNAEADDRKEAATVKRFHHQALPDFPALLSGSRPPTDIAFHSDRLQIWYNNTAEGWRDPDPHAHQDSDECFVVLRGTLVLEVEDERITVGPREFCCFPRGVYHSILKVHPPVESLMIRAPSIDDKVYQG